MLTTEDLKKIGEEVGQVIEHNVTPSLDKMNERLDKVESRLDTMDGRLDTMDGRLDTMDGRLDTMDGRIGRVEASMVTKSYLDDKLADLKGSLVYSQRKEDQKVNLLTDLLRQKAILSGADVASLQEIEVFPPPSQA